VELPFILAILQALGFGPYFINNIEAPFVDASTCLSINICSFEEVGFFRSIKYECPLAPTLYVLAVEVLGYLLGSKVSLGVIRKIPLLEPNIGKLVNVTSLMTL
jgi:hypothetical protein